jgi:hypothetical protein
MNARDDAFSVSQRRAGLDGAAAELAFHAE